MGNEDLVCKLNEKTAANELECKHVWLAELFIFEGASLGNISLAADILMHV